ncbi:Carboxylesterase NlhH [Rosistilla ulvae]|uniref:Carboxylesterase NlhH n=1 Tax=Rosistilla ulvae TaxID=1930277 RepID=A0A517M688_9BACT|nr:alpha/beta hydrolase [Rosistilla ulvae]QDS90394.1 Carboxylesterase NlhH [Rosistilla ulvae]
MQHVKSMALTASLIVCWATTSLGQSDGPANHAPALGIYERVQRDDQNQDGMVSRDEFRGPLRLFDRLDRDGDDMLTRKDFSMQPRRERSGMKTLDDVQVMRDVVYGQGGGRDLTMHLVLPKEPADQPLPVYVWLHGGGWMAGNKDGGVQQVIPAVRSGFVGATIEYRLSGEAIFPAQIEDCKCAIRYLRANAKKYNIDVKRIAVGGSSAGGHLAALIGTSAGAADLEGIGGWADQRSDVQAVVDLYGPTDLVQFVQTPGYESHARSNSPETRLLGGEVLKRLDAAEKANPIHYVDESDPPFLIIHGSNDRTVPANQSEAIYKALQGAGVDSKLHLIEGAGHGGREFAEPEIREMQLEFLLRTVGSQSSQE